MPAAVRRAGSVRSAGPPGPEGRGGGGRGSGSRHHGIALEKAAVRVGLRASTAGQPEHSPQCRVKALNTARDCDPTTSWGSTFAFPPIRELCTARRAPLIPLSQPPQPLLGLCSLLWIPSSTSMSFLNGEVQTWAQGSWCGLPRAQGSVSSLTLPSCDPSVHGVASVKMTNYRFASSPGKGPDNHRRHPAGVCSGVILNLSQSSPQSCSSLG